MATESIRKTVRPKDKKSARNLINAMEHAHGKSAKKVEITRRQQEIRGSEIRDFFGENQR